MTSRHIAQPRLELIVDIIWVIFAGWYLIATQSYPSVSRFVPTVFGTAALGLGIFQLLGNFIPAIQPLTKGDPPSRTNGSSSDLPQSVQNRRQLWAVLWAIGCVAGVYFLGFLVAIPLFMLVYFLGLDARRYWKLAIIGALAMGLLAYLVSQFSVPLPTGYLWSVLG